MRGVRYPTIVAACAGLSWSFPAAAQVLHDNGGLVTTPTPTCIPSGATASQLQTVGGFANGLIGIGCQVIPGTSNRAADDFVIPGPQSWNISSVQLVLYQTLWAQTSSPITAVNLRIWDGQPGTAGASVIWGDTVTNRLASGTFLNSYRTPAACSTSRMLFAVTANINTILSPGTYWLDWQAAGNLDLQGPWMPPVTITGFRGKPGANGIQFQSAFGTWDAVLDWGPAPETSPPIAQDFPFVLFGTLVSACYPNCDESTGTPLLTANDFQCFLNRFAAGDTRANCDESTGTPLLTANDFQCFLNKFAAGCS
ncbi:MAG: hypothetical protein KF678_06705 [Phycisphaeraceae bacterium]|nr:hypothetical protein [Phycisphaeraceae bacterium]